MFLVLQHLVAPNQMGPVVGAFFERFFSLSHIVVGVVYLALGCGIATAAAAILAMLWLVWRARPVDFGNSRVGPADVLGPTALVIPELAFFVASPGPTRHFMLTYAGFSIFLAIALTGALAFPRWAALGVALLLAGTSQVLAEAVRLPLLAANAANSAYLPIWTGYLTATHAPIGWVWQRHNALAERRALWNAEGNMLAAPCQTHTLVFTDDGTAQLFTRLYVRDVPVAARREGFDDILGTVRGDKVMLYIAKAPRWPDDPVGLILADSTFNDYKLVQDPYSMSKYDATAIPPERQAMFGCARGTP